MRDDDISEVSAVTDNILKMKNLKQKVQKGKS